MNTRILNWEGCRNVRDLGGLMTREGRTTRRGAVVRSDHPAKISAACPADLVTVEVAIEDISDAEFTHRWADAAADQCYVCPPGTDRLSAG